MMKFDEAFNLNGIMHFVLVSAAGVMARKFCSILCSLIVLVNIVGIFCHNIYEKNSNGYDLTYSENFTPNPTPGYVQVATILLEEFKSGKVPATSLNKFSSGLEQYVLYQLFEKYALENAKTLSKPEPISDPVSLPGYCGNGITFSNVQAYGLPALKTNKAELVYDGLSSVFEYQASIGYKSSVVIITGDILLSDNSTYFFVYNMKDASYRVKFGGTRGVKKVQHFKASLQFASEEFVHTYDSSYEKYAEISEALCKEFYDLLRTTYSMKILDLAHRHFAVAFSEKDVKFLAMYKEMLLSTIMESAIQFVSAKGANYFESSPLNFTNNVGPRVFVQTYKDIKLEGVLNFKRNELVESKIETIGENYNISNAIEFVYPEDGDKQAFVSFLVSDGRHENAKKFKVKSIKVIFVYNSPIAVRPPKVYRNKEVFFNGSGFLIKIEIDNFDPIYEFLIRHIGNDISRAIENILSESS